MTDTHHARPSPGASNAETEGARTMSATPHAAPIKIEPRAMQGPSLEQLSGYSDWRDNWTHIVRGRFSASLYSGLLFYSQDTGVAEFYATDGTGGISLLKHYDDWRTTWTHVVPGSFGHSGFTGILLYDQTAGFGAFYDTDGHGNIVLLREWHGWLTSWTHIVAGRFHAPFVHNEIRPSPYSGVLFYDQSAGHAEIHSTDGKGGKSLLKAYDDWRTSWTHIVAGEFINTEGFENNERVALTTDDLFFYEGSSGYGETYQSDGMGGIGHFDGWAQGVTPPLEPGPAGSESGLPPATLITAGSFGGATGNTNLIFHDQSTGHSSMRNFDSGGTNKWLPIEDFSWAYAWDALVAGNFWMADPADDQLFPDGAFTDLLFYQRDAGYGAFYRHEPPAPTPDAPFAGYVCPRSTATDETMQLHISSRVGPYSVRLYRQEVRRVYVGDVSDLPPTPQPLPIAPTSYRYGANWPVAGQFTIPPDWPSGLYFAQVTADGINAPLPDGIDAIIKRGRATRAPGRITPDVPPLDIPFVVRAGARRARILLAIADNTYNAYNFWGGRSLYGYGSNGVHCWVGPSATPFHAPHACHVSFLRPHAPVADLVAPLWQTWEVPLLQWIYRQGIAVDLCTESDLDSKPEIVNGYRLLIVAGHSEYWSGPMRDQVEGFVRGGGNVVFFSGNTCWWQVRFEDGGDTMVCYKQTFDPAYASTQKRKTTTVNWFEHFLHRPETQLTGVRYSWATYEPTTEFQVDEPDHWVFANTGLNQGDGFGLYANGTATVVGPETDITQQDSPSNFRKLAHVEEGQPPDGPYDVADMGLFSPNNTEDQFSGIVFTASTMDWTLGLSQDDSWRPIDQITRNLLIRLG